MSFNEKNRKIIEELLRLALNEIEELIDEGKIEFQNSKKNMLTFRELRRELGITHNDFQNEVLEAIKNLTIENYYEGPDSDYNIERDFVFWKFGTKVFDREIYLKITIKETEGKKVVVWSYHFPEYIINYPFKYNRRNIKV